MGLFRRYQGSYLSYVLAFFGYYFAMAVFTSVLSVYLTGLGKSASEMSFIVSASGIFSFFAVPLAGSLNDRTARPKLLSCGMLLGAGALGLVFAMSRSVWTLFLLNGLIMSLINSILPICERMAGASKYRYGALRVWGTLGYAAGAQGAGLALEYVEPAFIFVLLLASSLLAAAGFGGAETPSAVSPKREALPAPEKRPGLLAVLSNPSFLLFLCIVCLFGGSQGVNNTYAPMLLTSLGVPASAVGTVLFFSTLVEFPIILFSHRFMDRFSGKALLLCCFAITIVQFLCYGLFPWAGAVIPVMVLLKAVASTLFNMINLKVTRNLMDPRLTTTCLSVINSVSSMAGILLQNAGGLLVDRTGIPLLYLCLTVLNLAGLVLALFLKLGNQEKVFS